MLFSCLSLLLILMTWVGCGLIASRVLGLPKNRLTLPEYGIIGVFSVYSVGTFLHFFIPMSEVLPVLFGFTGAMGAILFRKDVLKPSFSRSNQILIPIVMALLTLAFAVCNFTGSESVILDTGLYHWPAILWRHDAPAAFGLANLHGRLGFNTAWFSLAALAWFPGLGASSVFSVNAALLLLFFYCFLFCALSGEAKPVARAFAWSCLIIFGSGEAFRSLIYWHLGSPSTDLPGALFGLIAILSLLKLDIEDEPDRVLLCLSAALAVMVKLSIAPILILVTPLFFQNGKLTKPLHIKACVAISCGLMFWVIDGIISSGCLAYPIVPTCIQKLPWAVKATQAKAEADWIRSWAREPWIEPGKVLGNWNWFPKWWEGFCHYQPLRVLAVFTVFGIVVWGIRSLLSTRSNSGKVLEKNKWIGLTTVLIGAVFWFIQAPDIRFGLAFFIGLACLCMTFAVTEAFLTPSKLTACMSIFLICSLCYLSWKAIYRVKGIKLNEIFEVKNPIVPPGKIDSKFTKQGKIVYVPQDTLCWTYLRPCAPHPNDNLIMDQELGHWIFELHD